MKKILTKKKNRKIWLILGCLAALCAAAAVVLWRRRRAEELNELEESEDDLFADGEVDAMVQYKVTAGLRTIEREGILPSLELRSRLASVELDLSEAVLPEDRFLEIDAVCSKVSVNAPEGAAVEVLGGAPMTSVKVNADKPEAKDAPKLYVYVYGFGSSVAVR